MAKSKPRKPFVPDPEQLALWPGVSGNAINGLGETERHQPRPIYWHDPRTLPHGPLMTYFRRVSFNPEVRAIREETLKLYEEPLPEPAARRHDQPPETWSRQAKEYALAHHADLVGVARVDPLWVFEGHEVGQPWIIMLGVAMDHGAISQAPGDTSQKEVQSQYQRGTRAAITLARWIRDQGFDAKPHGGPSAGSILMIPPAIAAGLGELGKHGSLINRELGSCFRLSCVLTDMPLVADAPDVFGGDDFCTACQACSKACPPDAIAPVKQWVRGDRKWYVDFDKCVLYFNENKGCGICLAVCPWSLPGVAPRLIEKMAARPLTGS